MMTRRRWLLLSVAAGASASALLLPWARIGHLPMARWFAPDSGLGPAADALLLSLDGASKIGSAWLANEGRGTELPALVERMVARIGDAGSREEMEARVAARILHEHEHGLVCEIDGWRLAQTECELAALRWLVFGAITASAAVAEADRPNGPEQALEGEIVEISNWGPRSTEQGMAFNVQPDGMSAMWFAAINAPSWVLVLIDGQPVATTVHDRSITIHFSESMGDRILATPGLYSVELFDPVAGVKQLVGEFEVRPRAERAILADGAQATSLCPVTAWGPDSTRAGEPANAQPDGSMGMWFHTDCAPGNVRLLFGEDRLLMTRTNFGLTARVPLALIEAPGEVALGLLDLETGEALPIGKVRILTD